jgi:hypothetical protein
MYEWTQKHRLQQYGSFPPQRLDDLFEIWSPCDARLCRASAAGRITFVSYTDVAPRDGAMVPILISHFK